MSTNANFYISTVSTCEQWQYNTLLETNDQFDDKNFHSTSRKLDPRQLLIGRRGFAATQAPPALTTAAGSSIPGFD